MDLISVYWFQNYVHYFSSLDQHFPKSILWNLSASLCIPQHPQMLAYKGFDGAECMGSTAYFASLSLNKCLWDNL